MPGRTKVFISYSQDSAEHCHFALDLANRLRTDGFACTIDQEIERPAGGWLHWMSRQLDESDVVLVICTERYYGISHDFMTPEMNLPLRWECVIDAGVINRTNDLRSRCAVFLPTVEDDPFVIEPLKGGPTFCFQNEEGYAGLLRHLRRPAGPPSQEEAPKPVADEADVIIRRDMFCLVCGYNLRTLSLGGICPECGMSIMMSMRSAYNGEYRDSDYTIALAEELDVGPDGIGLMIQSLASGSAPRRSAAAYALSRLGPAGAPALPQLMAALRDREGDVRWWAALALGRIGRRAESAAAALTEVLDDPDEEIAAVAQDSLRKIRAALAQQGIEQARAGGAAKDTSERTPQAPPPACDSPVPLGEDGSPLAAANASGIDDVFPGPLPADPHLTAWAAPLTRRPPPPPPPGHPHHQVVSAPEGPAVAPPPQAPSWAVWGTSRVAPGPQPAATVSGDTPMKWEYKTVTMDTHGFFGGKVDAREVDDALNKLGWEGWELVAAFDTDQRGGETRHMVFVFKRPFGR